MIPVTNLRAGTTFLLSDKPFKVIRYSHVKVGRGNATVKVRVKNLIDGSLIDKTFVSGLSVEPVVTTKRKLQFLYQDSDGFYFMDTKTYEQLTIERNILGTEGQFLKEGAELDVLFWEEKPLSVDLPPKVTLKITQADPSVKGNSASNVYKDAVLENGLKVRVPLFIKTGDLICVDTRTGEYIERATN